jgi:hypothetical protein
MIHWKKFRKIKMAFMGKLLIIAFSFIGTIQMNMAQTLMNLDSLLLLLPKAKADISKVDLLINIGQQ